MKTLSLACVLSLGTLFAGCGGGEKELPVLVVGHVGHDHQIALGVAALDPAGTEAATGLKLVELKEREVYRLHEKGRPLAELQLKLVGGGSVMPTTMAQGALDIGFGGIPAIAQAIDQGAAIRLLCPLNVDGDLLVMKPDWPAASWDEWVASVRRSPKPVRIGFKAPMAVTRIILEEACRAVLLPCVAAGTGAGAGTVEMVNMNREENLIPLLRTDALDGSVINEPWGAMAVHEGLARKVCLLSELPPPGQWLHHPCCGICAREEIMVKHGKAVDAFLRLMAGATAIIEKDRRAAAELAARWTKKPIEVERLSVPNIVYTTALDETYRKGMTTWMETMAGLGFFKGSLKGLASSEALARLHGPAPGKAGEK